MNSVGYFYTGGIPLTYILAMATGTGLHSRHRCGRHQLHPGAVRAAGLPGEVGALYCIIHQHLLVWLDSASLRVLHVQDVFLTLSFI
jgi:hypothetical protein